MGSHLTTWWGDEGLKLGPPLYGYQDRFPNAGLQRRIPPTSRPVHTQRILHIKGSTASTHSNFVLRNALFVRGALWRWSSHQLCTALDRAYGPANEVRECSHNTGKFHALVWVMVPGSLPQHWPLSHEMGIPLTPHETPGYIDRPCEWTKPLVAAQAISPSLIDIITVACNRRPAAGNIRGGMREPNMERLFGIPTWNSKNKSALFFGGVGIAQIWGDTMLAIGVAFLEAARTLPQPFGIVESGNLCGASTMLIALLKKRFCPKCRFVSADPGWYRLVRKQKMTCAADMLTWAGLRDEVTLTNPEPISRPRRPPHPLDNSKHSMRLHGATWSAAGSSANLLPLSNLLLLPQVELIDDMTTSVPVELPVGFVYLDDGKARSYALASHGNASSDASCTLIAGFTMNRSCPTLPTS